MNQAKSNLMAVLKIHTFTANLPQLNNYRAPAITHCTLFLRKILSALYLCGKITQPRYFYGETKT